MAKKFSTHCKHVPCSTLTHSTNEDLLNIKRKCDLEISYPLWYVQYHFVLLIIDISKHGAKEMGHVKMAGPGFVNDVTA